MPGVEGRVALVTGAGKGIGRSVAECFVREGATVIGVARTEADLDGVAKGLAGAAGTFASIPGDVTDENEDMSLHAGILPRNDEGYQDTMFTKVRS